MTSQLMQFQVDYNIKYLASQVGFEAKQGALQTARTILTEDNTDALISIVVPRIKSVLPMWLRWLPIGAVMDKLLPGALLSVIEEVLG